jgi:hypothetical protein
MSRVALVVLGCQLLPQINLVPSPIIRWRTFASEGVGAVSSIQRLRGSGYYFVTFFGYNPSCFGCCGLR